jgi:hypothetical protein
MKNVVEEKIKVGKSRLFILFLIAGIVILVLANSKNLSGISAQHQTLNMEEQPSRVYAVTNSIALTDQWSEPPVETENSQIMWAIVSRGQATEYEVRDADHPEHPYPYHHGETLHTDGARIYKWQWRVSGQVISGPIELKYIVCQN